MGDPHDIAPRGSQHLGSLEHARTASPHHSPFDIVFQPFRAGPMGSARVSLRSQVSRVEGCNFAGSQQVSPKPSPHGRAPRALAPGRRSSTGIHAGAELSPASPLKLTSRPAADMIDQARCPSLGFSPFEIRYTADDAHLARHPPYDL